jgi:hypothetical protein
MSGSQIWYRNKQHFDITDIVISREHCIWHRTHDDVVFGGVKAATAGGSPYGVLHLNFACWENGPSISFSGDSVEASQILAGFDGLAFMLSAQEENLKVVVNTSPLRMTGNLGSTKSRPILLLSRPLNYHQVL